MTDYIEHDAISDSCVKSFAIFNQLRKNGQLCDVSINVDGKTLYAHKNVLSAGSPYLMKMFTLPTIEADQKEIIIPDVSFETMEQIITFIYTGRMEISNESSPNLLKAANFLQMEKLVSLCGNYMMRKIDETNCFATRKAITVSCDEDIVERANGYVNANFEKISENESFLQLDIKMVVELLSSSEICCVSEESVLWAALRWLDVTEDRKQFLQQILDCIRLPGLSEIFDSKLINNIQNTDTIPRSIELAKTPRTLKTIILAVNRGKVKDATAHQYWPSTKQWRKSFSTAEHCCEQLTSNGGTVFLTGSRYQNKTYEHYVMRKDFNIDEWQFVGSFERNLSSKISAVLCVGQKLYMITRNEDYYYKSFVPASSATANVQSATSTISGIIEAPSANSDVQGAMNANLAVPGTHSASSVVETSSANRDPIETSNAASDTVEAPSADSGVLKAPNTNSDVQEASNANSAMLESSSANSEAKTSSANRDPIGTSNAASDDVKTSSANSGVVGVSTAKYRVRSAPTEYLTRDYDQKIDIYDMETNTWSTGPAIEKAMDETKFVALDKFIYVFQPATMYASHLKKLNTETQEMTEIPLMLTKRRDFGIATYKGKIYIAGGRAVRAETFDFLKSVEVYDPVKNEWKELAPMVKAGDKPKLVATTDGIFALSRDHRWNHRNDCIGMQFYSVEKNTWTVEDNCPETLKSKNIAACAVPNVYFPF